MPEFYITEQHAVVVEITYAVDAANIDAVENMDRPEYVENEIHRETIKSNFEITNIEEVSA